MSTLIREFVMTKEFFLNEDEARVEFDYVTQMHEEEQALQEIGIEIKENEVLMQVAIMILQQIYD